MSSSKQSPNSQIKRLLSPDLSFTQPLFSSLEAKILSYQDSQKVDLRKTYLNFLEIGNSPCKPIPKTIQKPPKVRMARTSYTSISLNETKIMKKSMKSMKEYQKTLKTEEEEGINIKEAEGTLKKHFSLARFLLEGIISHFRQIQEDSGEKGTQDHEFQKQLLVEKFKVKCESLQENIRKMLGFLEKEKEVSFFFETPMSPIKNVISRKAISPFSPTLVNKENCLLSPIETKRNVFFPAFNLDSSLLLPIKTMSKNCDTSNKFLSLKEKYDTFLTNVVSLAQSLNLRELYVYLMLLHAKFCMELKEPHKAIAILKQAKSVSSELNFPLYCLRCYERMGRAFQSIRDFKRSLRCFVKMLEMALISDNHRKELQAYDMIGLQFFYQGKTDIAQFFHCKLLEGDLEPEDSNLRRIAKQKYALRTKTMNFSVPGYIASRTGLQNYENLDTNYSSDENDNDLKLEEVMTKYKESTEFWMMLEKKIPKKKINGGPINHREVLEKANKNIRPTKLDQFSSLDLKEFRIRKKTIDGLATQKSGFLRINHLSPNRSFAKPNIYEFRMNKLSKEDPKKLIKKVNLIGQRVFERLLKKFQGLFEKIRNNLRVVLMQSEFYIGKLQFPNKISKNSRKNALFCSPLLRKSMVGVSPNTRKSKI